MRDVDYQDIALTSCYKTKHEQLYYAIRERIMKGQWFKGGKLPSTRTLSKLLNLSRNTVSRTYDSLATEGYIKSVPACGFFVQVELPDEFISNFPTEPIKFTKEIGHDINAPFAPGIPDLTHFPIEKWKKLINRHSSRRGLLGNNDIKGDENLRVSICNYLKTSRSAHCTPDQILITNGAQQALYIALLSILEPSEELLIESPGYPSLYNLVKLMRINYKAVNVDTKEGVNINSIIKSKARAVYLTPSNQYPIGSSINIQDRIKLIKWANENNSFIIEDDYDSEFQYSHKPIASLQGLASNLGCASSIIYLGSFSKTLFNNIRIGYMILPKNLVAKCSLLKKVTTSETPALQQAALSDFINEGQLSSHIKKMRIIYKEKYNLMLEAINTIFGSDIEVVGNANGHHITIIWYNGISEDQLVLKSREIGINMRPLNYYEFFDSSLFRNYNSVVLGFGNIRSNDIFPTLEKISRIFYRDKT